MKSPDLRLFAGLLAVTLGLLGGCTLPAEGLQPLPVEEERHLSPGLQAPEDVPRKKWSDAMLVLDAMGISGQHDLPRQPAGSAPATGLVTSVDMITPTGKVISPVREFQAVAWVPVDNALTPKMASIEAVRVFEAARRHAFWDKFSTRKPQAGAYPNGSDERYETLGDIFQDRPAPFRRISRPVPAIIGSGDAYGPIFIESQFTVDADLNRIDVQETMRLLSKELPAWFYLYLPDKGNTPAQVFNRGKVMYFVGK